MTKIGKHAWYRSAGHVWPAGLLVLGTALAVVMATQSTAGAAVAPVDLGTAGTFGVLAGSTVTNTGASFIGGDLGSTTTKAVLLDPATRAVVASHYTRTKGDPVAAARECLQALVNQLGNRRVRLIGTTGSARELVGSYLGTEHVFNEISAQAAGANHFDADVDTIFEIGGQDAKYIRLRNGVPIDYAMNSACSAGTGSFLEESAQGDLGIAVSDIADIALTA